MTTTYQNSRVIAVVHSHVGALQEGGKTQGRVIDLSADVIALQTQKKTKACGRWQLKLVPRRNYLNYVFPNDIVNIYIDPGDGKRGFIRTMMGYVDRVERSETTDPETGAVSTQYVIMGSDFQKAVDRTSIYFNAHMRQILDERFARTDQGALRGRQRNDADGSALRNAGLVAFGTPADFVENILMTLMGFGQQWRLPPGYAKNRSIIDANRRKRVQRAMSRIPDNIRTAVQTLGLNLEATSQSIQNILNIADEVKTEAELEGVEANEQYEAARTLAQNPTLKTARSLLFQLESDPPVGIIDLLSLDFIEALAIDGFHQNATIWQNQGAVSQFLYGNSNDIVNELMFDLRPVSRGEEEDGGLLEGDYSREPDELGYNVDGLPGFPVSVHGVKYEPAVVFREYPYSVVNSFELTNVIVVPEGADVEAQDLNTTVFFGPVFSKDPNPSKAKRVTYRYPKPITPSYCKFFNDHEPVKHLDVVPIRNTDVVSSQLGRSDDDLFNVFSLHTRSSVSMGDAGHQRSVLTNFTPVLNQVSIARHGLRSYETTTQFANHSRTMECGVGGSPDGAQVRKNLVRWQLLIDHWYQHNAEYISGTITLRGMPEIRAGYRLDWVDRNESYYVEGVTQTWQYPGVLQTTVQVSRGQRNDPFPVYIPPVFIDGNDRVVTQASGDRSETGRLGRFFKVKDTKATAHSPQRRHDPGALENDEDTPEGVPRGGTVVFPGDTGQRKSAAHQQVDDIEALIDTLVGPLFEGEDQ